MRSGRRLLCWSVDIDWAAPAAWENRSSDFGDLVLYEDGRPIVAMEYRAALPSRTREVWLDCSRHPNLVDAIDIRGDALLLRYAGVNWLPRKLVVDTKRARAIVASWAVQLASMFEAILGDVAVRDHQHLLCAVGLRDLDDQVRVVFSSASPHLPPDKRVDQRSFVYVIGKILASLVDTVPDGVLRTIVTRCCEPWPRDRFPTLAALAAFCRSYARDEPVRVDERALAWSFVEEGIGWLALGHQERALGWFQRADALCPDYQHFVDWGLAQSNRPVRLPMQPILPSRPYVPPPPPPLPPARAAYAEGRARLVAGELHEAQARFTRAMALEPTLLEAQLLHGATTRMLARLRAATGISAPPTIDVPEALRSVRELVLAGRLREAIAHLATEPVSDATTLLRGRLLALDGQLDAAATAFGAITEGEHAREALLERARVTLDRGAPDAALAIVDQLLARSPRDLGALELRARCLELAGHAGEASAAMRAFVAAVELASDVRLANL